MVFLAAFVSINVSRPAASSALPNVSVKPFGAKVAGDRSFSNSAFSYGDLPYNQLLHLLLKLK